MAMSPTLLRPRRRAAVPPPPIEGSAPSAPTGISLTTAPLVPTALTLATAPSPPTGVTVETGLVAPTNVGLLAAPKNLTATEVFAPDSPTGLDLTAVPASPTGVQLSAAPSEPTSVTVASVPGSPTGVGLLGAPTNVVATESAATDPYFSDVVLLFSMDGSNGSTTFVDQSANGATVIANGDSQLSTSQSKFGGSSYLGDGNGDYLSVSGDLRLTGDFTVESWVYPTTTSGARWIINIGSETTGRFLFGILNGNLAMDRQGVATNVFTNGSVSINQWSHVAITREGSNLRAFVNGTLLQTVIVGGTLGNANHLLRVGMSNSADQSFLGHIDDLRITTVARYTSNFTPPTSAFPS